MPPFVSFVFASMAFNALVNAPSLVLNSIPTFAVLAIFYNLCGIIKKKGVKMLYEPSGLALIFAIWFLWRLCKDSDKKTAAHDAELKSVKETYQRGYEIRLSDLKHVTAEELNALHIKFIF